MPTMIGFWVPWTKVRVSAPSATVTGKLFTRALRKPASAKTSSLSSTGAPSASTSKTRAPTAAVPPITNNDPTAPVQPGGDLKFRIEGVQHNVQTPTGNFMAIAGSGRIPPGRGVWWQVVVYFFLDAGGGAKGQPVRAMFSNYADAHGNAATGTPGFAIGPAGVAGRWTVYIPYAAFQTGYGWVTGPDGQSYYQPGTVGLVAEAVHFIDNFGVMTGATVPFSITY